MREAVGVTTFVKMHHRDGALLSRLGGNTVRVNTDLPVEVVPVVPKLAAAPPGRAVQSSLARARASR